MRAYGKPFISELHVLFALRAWQAQTQLAKLADPTLAVVKRIMDFLGFHG
jgi:hypothetical protein